MNWPTMLNRPARQPATLLANASTPSMVAKRAAQASCAGCVANGDPSGRRDRRDDRGTTPHRLQVDVTNARGTYLHCGRA